MHIQENVPLHQYTTFRVGGPARFFVVVKSAEELLLVLEFARQKKVPIFVLGGGSNILVDDAGFTGLVIKNEIKGLEYKENGDDIELCAGAGENWDDVVKFCVEKGFGGLENLSAIPGTVGAAPVQNIGAYGSEVKDSIQEVEAINIETLEVKYFTAEECMFEYRNSFFKKPEGKKYCITKVFFHLKKNAPLNTSYKDIAAYLKEHAVQNPTLAIIRDAVISIRAAKLPPLKEFGTAGSFFKNPIITKKAYEDLKTKYPLLPFYELRGKEGVFTKDTHVKVPAAWILDNICGFKGVKEGNVGVYKNQALVLVNFGGAHGNEVKELAQHMIEKVFEMTGIKLEPEVEYVD